MPYSVSISDASSLCPEYTFISALTPSEQKAAFQVRDSSGKSLCLKMIAPSYAMERLQREILALQRLNHPNVASLIDYEFSTRGGRIRHFMVEDFIDGQDLEDLIQSGGQRSLTETADLFHGIAKGLFAIHSVNIVHRDIKPKNIRVRPDFSPVIIDFGLARHLTLPDITNTAHGAGIGTPLYFAPEQFNGTKRDIDTRTDLFALGIILYQATVGEHPFYSNGMTISQLSDSVCTSSQFLSKPKFISLPQRWRTLISRVLEKDKARRPQNADQVATILTKIRSDA